MFGRLPEYVRCSLRVATEFGKFMICCLTDWRSSPSKPAFELTRSSRTPNTHHGLPVSAGSASDWARHSIKSEEHTSELQSLMRISSAVFCLKKKTKITRRKREQNNNLWKTQNTNVDKMKT